MYRENTKEIAIGNVKIGGTHPVTIQSMTNTKTENVKETVDQILRLEAAGCEIIRCAVPTMEAAEALKEIKKQIHIPLVADIHFDYRLAIAAIENGADKIRINPGNIGSEEKVQAVVDKAKEYNVPIRVGVNSGSLEKHILEKYNGVTAEGIVESALDKVHMIEKMGYDNLVVSIKSSDVLMCVKAHELIAKACPYPLHVGITESGTVYSGNIKSSIGLGSVRCWIFGERSDWSWRSLHRIGVVPESYGFGWDGYSERNRFGSSCGIHQHSGGCSWSIWHFGYFQSFEGIICGCSGSY